jgi:hypothetical protein
VRTPSPAAASWSPRGLWPARKRQEGGQQWPAGGPCPPSHVPPATGKDGPAAVLDSSPGHVQPGPEGARHGLWSWETEIRHLLVTSPRPLPGLEGAVVPRKLWEPRSPSQPRMEEAPAPWGPPGCPSWLWLAPASSCWGLSAHSSQGTTWTSSGLPGSVGFSEQGLSASFPTLGSQGAAHQPPVDGGGQSGAGKWGAGSPG